MRNHSKAFPCCPSSWQPKKLWFRHVTSRGQPDPGIGGQHLTCIVDIIRLHARMCKQAYEHKARTPHSHLCVAQCVRTILTKRHAHICAHRAGSIWGACLAHANSVSIRTTADPFEVDDKRPAAESHTDHKNNGTHTENLEHKASRTSIAPMMTRPHKMSAIMRSSMLAEAPIHRVSVQDRIALWKSICRCLRDLLSCQPS